MDLLFYIQVIITLIAFIFCKKKYNPLVLFSCYWTILMFLSLLEWFGVPKASDNIYTIISIGVLSYVSGAIAYYVIFKIAGLRFNYNNFDTKAVMLLNNTKSIKIIDLYLKVITLLLFFYCLRTVSLLSNGLLLYFIRSNFVELILVNKIEIIFWNFVIWPSSVAIIVLGLYLNIIERMPEKYLLYSLMNAIMMAVCSGGRMYLFYFIMLYLYMCLMRKNESEERTFRKYLKQIFLISMCLLIINYISNQREIGTGFFESIYIYLTGCFPFFEEKVAEVSSSNFSSYGVAFFNAPFTLLFMTLFNIGLIDYPDIYLICQNFINGLQSYMYIGRIYFNAFGTIFYSFYLDGGIIGICLGSFLFGYISELVFFKAYYTRTPRSILLYSVIVLCILTSMVRWQLGKTEFFMAVVYLTLLTKDYRKYGKQTI